MSKYSGLGFGRWYALGYKNRENDRMSKPYAGSLFGKWFEEYNERTLASLTIGELNAFIADYLYDAWLAGMKHNESVLREFLCNDCRESVLD